METSTLVSVQTLTNAIKAELIKNMLEEEGIRCFLDGEEASANLGLAVFEINVMVPTADEERARILIDEHEHHHEDLEEN